MQYELNERKRDAEAEKRLDNAGVVCQEFDDSVMLAPGSVQTGDGNMYKGSQSLCSSAASGAAGVRDGTENAQ